MLPLDDLAICFLTKMLAILFGQEEVKQLEVSQIHTETQNYQKETPKHQQIIRKICEKQRWWQLKNFYFYHYKLEMIHFDFRIFFRWVEDPRLGCALGRQVGGGFFCCLFFFNQKKPGEISREKRWYKKETKKLQTTCFGGLGCFVVAVFWEDVCRKYQLISANIRIGPVGGLRKWVYVPGNR